MKPDTDVLQHRLPNSLFGGSTKSNILLSLLLVLATVALYYPVHRHGFANFDDGVYITENPHIRSGLDWDVVQWAFLHSYEHNWHPLTWISHAIDVDLFDLDPAGPHVVNMLLHALNAVLLFWVLQRATGYAGRSFMVAALFALHPVNVESVAWIAERKNVLSMVFFLLALGAYRWYVREPQKGGYYLVGFLYLLGLMSKAQVITLPFVLLLWDYWPLHRMSPEPSGTEPSGPYLARTFWQLVAEKLPLMLIAAASGMITKHAQHVAKSEQWPYTFFIRLENAVVSYARYLGNALWPSRLALMYPHPGYSLQLWQFLAALLLLLAITAVVIAGRRHRYLPVGWFWFLGTLVPMIGLVQVSVQGMADRYAYQSYIGLFLMVCWGVAEWSEQRHLRPAILTGMSVVVLLALAVVAHRQIGYWSDNVTLWAHASEVTNNNWMAELNLGNALWTRGQPDQAFPHFLKSAAIKPDNAATNLNIGLYQQAHGNLREAIACYQKAATTWQLPEQRVTALTQMARAYRDLGDNTRAKECIEEAGRPAPRQP